MWLAENERGFYQKSEVLQATAILLLSPCSDVWFTKGKNVSLVGALTNTNQIRIEETGVDEKERKKERKEGRKEK